MMTTSIDGDAFDSGFLQVTKPEEFGFCGLSLHAFCSHWQQMHTTTTHRKCDRMEPCDQGPIGSAHISKKPVFSQAKCVALCNESRSFRSGVSWNEPSILGPKPTLTLESQGSSCLRSASGSLWGQAPTVVHKLRSLRFPF